jgi:multidrug efflux pump subunit AcrA (membrane-fusion protein)
MSSTVQTQSHDEFEDAKRQIRGIIGEIAQLAKSDLQPEEFYAAFLQRVVQALAAVGGAVWTLGEGKRPQLTYQINLSPALLEAESDDAIRHARLLDMVVNSNQPQLVPPLSGNEQGGNPTRNLLILAPLGHDKQVEGLVEIFQRPNTQPNTQRGYLKFLLQMCELAGEWYKSRKLSSLSDRTSLWAQADQFARLVHDSLDFRETAYTIVNEGRKLIGCDRVTVCVQRGGVCKVEAISGQDTLDNRSNVVYNLGILATKVVNSGETLYYHGSTEDMPPQIEQAIEKYVDESYTKSMIIMPLRKPRPGDDHILNPDAHEELQPREIIGALIIEQLETDVPREILDPRIDLVYEHAARAMSNTLDHNNLFLMPVWRAVGKSKVVVQGRNLPKTITISAIVVAVLLFMLIWPTDLALKAKGALQPIDKQDVFAPQSGGDVEQVLHDDGEMVKKGDTLIVLRNEELAAQIAQLTGEVLAAQKRAGAIAAELLHPGKMTPGERAQMEIQKAELQEELDAKKDALEVKERQFEKLTIKAPRDGKIVTWDAKENLLGRPVQGGDSLMTVTDPNSTWQLELYLPERRAGWLREALLEAKQENKDVRVRFILMTDPHKTRYGKVREVENSTFVHEDEGPCVRVKVDLDESIENPRPNATITANIVAGRTNLAYYWFHEAWEYVQANFLFF